MRKVICIVSVSIVLCGCHLNDADRAKYDVQQELIHLDRRDSLQGIDKDKNGIRDDIDEYIQNNFEDEKEQILVSNVARNLQKSLTIDLTKSMQVLQANKQLESSIVELNNLFNIEDTHNNIVETLQSLTSNTGYRFAASMSFSETVEKLHSQSYLNNRLHSIKEASNARQYH